MRIDSVGAKDSSSRPERTARFVGYDPQAPGRGALRAAGAVAAIFLLAFGAWAGLAPLDAAAIAPGSIVLDRDRQPVQHLEGGIVERVLVSEGDVVERGAPVVVVRDLQQRTQAEALAERIASARATRARLIAERDDAPQVRFDATGAGLGLDPGVVARMEAAERRLFEARREAVRSKEELIRSRQAQAQAESRALAAERDAVGRQLALAQEELATVSDLAVRGIVTEPVRREAEREAVALEGEHGALAGEIARVEQAILTADIEIVDLRNERRSAVLTELGAIEVELLDLAQQRASALDRLDRTQLVAPATGQVLNLSVTTPGAVITPGEVLMEIVPQDDRRIVEARLRPEDIDLVAAGGEAEILLVAYRAIDVPRLRGTVLSVSGDIVVDQASGERSFLVRVAIDDGAIERLTREVRLDAGMPVQVFLLAQERTLLEYLLGPILDAGRSAFRES